MLNLTRADESHWTSLPARRLHDALRAHDIHDIEVTPRTRRVRVTLDVSDVNRLATILDEAAAR